MLQSRFKNAVVGVAMAAAVALGAAGTAEAAVYNGSWEPAFGAPFNSLGWRGEAIFSIPDTCLALGMGTYLNTGANCGGMMLVSAEVVFYPYLHPNQIAQTLQFNDTHSLVDSMSVDSEHRLSRVVGDFNQFIPSSTSIAGDSNTFFDLQFMGGYPQLHWKNTECENEFDVERALMSRDDDNCGGYSSPPSDPNSPLYIKFTPAVPEPSTYALFAAGLAAMWQIRRRRR